MSLCTKFLLENIFFLASSAERDCTRNSKRHFVSRVTYQIHNGNNKEDIVTCRETTVKNNQFSRKNSANMMIQGVPHHIRPRKGLNYDFRD